MTKPAKKSRKFTYVVIGVLLLAVVLIAGLIMAKRKTPPVEVMTEPAEVRTLIQTVSATGKIQPVVEVKIFSEVGGEIIELPFREGDRVKKGDLLVRIKPDQYKFEVDQAEANLTSAKASARDNEARLVKAKEDLRRNEELFVKGLLSDSEVASERASYVGAEAALAQAQAKILSQEGALKQAVEKLGKTTLYSPFDGTVSARGSEVGERVTGQSQFSGTEIMRVANLEQMELRVQVNESDIVKIAPGQKSKITIDAYRDHTFEGTVKEIGSLPKVQGAMTTQDDVTNFQVKILLAPTTEKIRPNMSASVEVETKRVEGVVSVPTQAVTVRSRDEAKTIADLANERKVTKKDKTEAAGGVVVENYTEQEKAEKADREKMLRVVFLLEGEKVKMVQVKTGTSDSTHLEITSGLKAGDVVVTGSYAALSTKLKDGSKVKVIKKGQKP